MGRYAARTRFVEVFLSRNNGKLSRRDYAGVYVLEEKIKRAPDRVEIKKLTPEDKAEPNITGGYIFKRDHANRPWTGRSAFLVRTNSPQEDEADLTPAAVCTVILRGSQGDRDHRRQKTYLTRYLGQFERALYGRTSRIPRDGYAKYLDVDSFIDQFWMVELSKNVDGFRYSCYMFKDRGGKLRVEPIWDWNLSFGNANYHQGWVPSNGTGACSGNGSVLVQPAEPGSRVHAAGDRSLDGIAPRRVCSG